MSTRRTKDELIAWIKYVKELLENDVKTIWIVQMSLGDASRGYAWRAFYLRNGELENITYKLGVCLQMPWDKRLKAIKTPPFCSNGEVEFDLNIKDALGLNITIKEVL